jgi:high-affinity iron transporter
MWAGVALALAICAAGGIVLELVSRSLPQKEQEGLETVIALIAVATVTFMIVWMRRHARGLKKSLESQASQALATGSLLALVAMAFLAVIREGFETAVFLLAAFDSSTNPVAAGAGAVLGVAVATVIGYGIFRGAVRFDLSRFFRVTGLVLVLVAAGLLASAMHTAHEAGWLNVLQAQALDLRWLVAPGSVRSSLLTGLFGFQPEPVVAEVIAYVVYAIPMTIYVLWPSGGVRRREAKRSRGAVATGQAA